MKNPSKDSFKLQKIKLGTSGGLTVDFEVTEVIGAESYKSSQTQKSSKEPHPDLGEKLHAMGAMVAQVFGFMGVRTIADTKEFKADVLQKELVAKWIDEIIGKIRVTGISISGEDKTFGVVITASYAVDNGQRVAMNTPRILISGESRGFEEKLGQLVEEIQDEAYQFVYNRKVANPEMFDYE